jgi:hypothetical protein
MPSYRVILDVGALRPGVAAPAVADGASAAAAAWTTVEAVQIGLVRGVPQLTVRFTSVGPEEAGLIAADVVAAATALAVIPRWRLAERHQTRWPVIAAG